MKNWRIVAIGFMLLGLGCSESNDPTIEEELDLVSDWTDATHGNAVDPNYDVVFPESKVLRMDIQINAEDWASMQSDLDINLKSTGGGGGPQGGGGPIQIDFTPIWVPATVTFEDKSWQKVGIRYKGNSTLTNAYQSGKDKYPFKLDFDQYEETYPEIANQRFYGFKQLNLGNNDNDPSCMRDKVAADLFREFGVPAARTSFCQVYLDRGNGANFIGIYTIVEEVDNTVADSQFEKKSGNLYKPDGTGASFALGSYSEDDMDKKSNEEEADFSDVKALYDLLHDESRTINSTQWQTNLESIFNVDEYLKYLAANNVIQNWDTYGRMTHNYFLYNDQGRLTWIPWDNNEAMQDGKMGGALSLLMDEVTNDWPIIRYIIDVPTYKEQYDFYVNDFVSNVFETTKMNALYGQYETLLSTYAAQENVNISSGVSDLKSHVERRKQAVTEYLRGN